jgi:hypothetical protein
MVHILERIVHSLGIHLMYVGICMRDMHWFFIDGMV